MHTFSMNRAVLLCFALSFLAITNGSRLEDLLEELKRRTSQRRQQACDADAAFKKCHTEAGLKPINTDDYDWTKDETKEKFECDLIKMNSKDCMEKFHKCWVGECPEDANRKPPKCNNECDADAAFKKCHSEAGLKPINTDDHDWTKDETMEKFECDLIKMNSKDAMETFGKCWVGECPEDANKKPPKCDKACDAATAFKKCHREAGLKYINTDDYDWTKDETKDKFECDLIKMNSKDAMETFGKCWVGECPEDANKKPPKCDKEDCDDVKVFWKCQAEARLKMPNKTYNWKDKDADIQFQCDLIAENSESAMDTFGNCWINECPEGVNKPLPDCVNISKSCDEGKAFLDCQMETNLQHYNLSKYDWDDEDVMTEFVCDLIEQNSKDTMKNFEACWAKNCPRDANRPAPNCKEREHKGCDAFEVFTHCRVEESLATPNVNHYDWNLDDTAEEFFCDFMDMNTEEGMDRFGNCWMAKCPEDDGLPDCETKRRRNLRNMETKSVLLKKLLKLIDLV